MKVAVSHGIMDLKEIRDRYNEYAAGGSMEDDEEQLPPITPFKQRTEVIITPDQEYNQYLNTLPDNQRFTPNEAYDSYFYWKLNGKPKNFEEAYNKGMFHFDHSDGGYHANSIQFGDDGVGYFMKPKTHDTVGYETDWYNKGIVTEESGRRRFVTDKERQELEDFRRRFKLIDDSNRPNFFMYAPRNVEAKGGGIHIKPENRGKFTALKERTGHSATWFKEHGTPAQKKMATFALNARKWKHGDGGNLFNGESQNSNQMQIGRNYWQSNPTTFPFLTLDFPVNGGTLQEIVVTGKDRRKERLARLQKLAEKRANDYLTTSNDNTWVETGVPGREKNPHLAERANEGAKAHRAWEEEHPNLTAWGNLAGAIPFAVAAAPAVIAGGDALAATTLGEAITSGLTPLAEAANVSILGAPAMAWADAALSSVAGARGIQEVSEGNFTPMTAIELSPILRLGKPLSETAGTAYSSLVDKYPGLEQYPRYAIGKFKYGFDAELPTLYRKLKDALPVADANGNITLTNPNSRFRYVETGKDPMITNFTTDVPVRSHPSGHWEEGDVLALDGKTLLGYKVVSTRPSDTFTIDSQVKTPVSKTIFITGDADMTAQAKSAGYNVYSPEGLQTQYQAADNAANNAGKLAHREDFFKGYEDFVEGETRGLFKAPTAKDYAFMDYVFKPTYTSQTEPLSNLSAYKAKGMMTAPMWLRRLAGTNDYKWRGIEHLDGNVLYHPYDPVESIFRKENGIEILRKIPQVIRDSWKNK